MWRWPVGGRRDGASGRSAGGNPSIDFRIKKLLPISELTWPHTIFKIKSYRVLLKHVVVCVLIHGVETRIHFIKGLCLCV